MSVDSRGNRAIEQGAHCAHMITIGSLGDVRPRIAPHAFGSALVQTNEDRLAKRDAMRFSIPPTSGIILVSSQSGGLKSGIELAQRTISRNFQRAQQRSCRDKGVAPPPVERGRCQWTARQPQRLAIRSDGRVMAVAHGIGFFAPALQRVAIEQRDGRIGRKAQLSKQVGPVGQPAVECDGKPVMARDGRSPCSRLAPAGKCTISAVHLIDPAQRRASESNGKSGGIDG